MGKFIDRTGQKYGKLTVLKFSGFKDKYSMWECLCECGNKTIVRGCNLGSGHTQSCGCMFRVKSLEVNTTHNCTKTRLYKIWSGMKGRCYNPNDISYQNYGGRGVRICDEWMEFVNFRDWAISTGFSEVAPREQFSIDRIDVNGDYSPENCRWVTLAEQRNNKQNTVYIDYGGEKLTAKEWSVKRNIPYKKIMDRLYKGFSAEKILAKGDLRCAH